LTPTRLDRWTLPKHVRVSEGELRRSGVLVCLPSTLRALAENQEEVLLEASNAAILLHRLDETFPGIRDRVVDETGRLRPFVNLFVNEDLVRAPLSEVSLKAGDVVHILPSVAGGIYGG